MRAPLSYAFLAGSLLLLCLIPPPASSFGYGLALRRTLSLRPGIRGQDSRHAPMFATKEDKPTEVTSIHKDIIAKHDTSRIRNFSIIAHIGA